MSVFLLASLAHSSPIVDRWREIHEQALARQGEIVQSAKVQKQGREQVRKLKELLALQAQEKELTKVRVREIEGTIRDLETQKGALLEKIRAEKGKIRAHLRAVEQSKKAGELSILETPLQEQWEAPKRHAMVAAALIGLKTLEIHNIDLKEASEIERALEEERSKLAQISEELKNQETFLSLSRKLQIEKLTENYQEQVKHLEEYVTLQQSQSHIEGLLKEFNARHELASTATQEIAGENKFNSPGAVITAFQKKKGLLPWPVATTQGQIADASTNSLSALRGIHFEGLQSHCPVVSVASGVVAYVGSLGGVGSTVIIDHGEQYYTLAGNLSEIEVKLGAKIETGSRIGTIESGLKGQLYFELRSRNVPLDPRGWLKSKASQQQAEAHVNPKSKV